MNYNINNWIYVMNNELYEENYTKIVEPKYGNKTMKFGLVYGSRCKNC